MVALETGWTPDVLAEMPDRFRRGAHWALYARAIVGQEGLSVPTLPEGASPVQRVALAKARIHADKLRQVIFPEDDGDE